MKEEQSPHPEPKGRLMASDRIEGTPLYDSKGETIAVLEDLVIDPVAGEVHFVLVSPKGGGHLKPIPWDHLKFDLEKQAYIACTSAEVIEEAPALEAGEVTDWTDESWNARVRSHYVDKSDK